MASTERHHGQVEELRRRVVNCRERLRRHRHAQHRAGELAAELINAEPPPLIVARTTATDARAGRPAFVAAFRRDARF